MSDQPTTRPSEGSPEYRAAVVAGIRALADLIETNTDLPVPNSVDAQYSKLDGTDEDKVSVVRSAALELGDESSVGDTATARKTVAAGGYPGDLPWFRVDYIVHAELQGDGGEQA